jgi:hypothetical protein
MSGVRAVGVHDEGVREQQRVGRVRIRVRVCEGSVLTMKASVSSVMKTTPCTEMRYTFGMR